MKTSKRRFMSVLLAVALVLSVLPVASLAAEPTAPQFVTKDQLKTFDTDSSNGDNAAKIYFGKKNLQWHIVGSQSDGSIVLFATAPVGSNSKFEAAWNASKTSPALWQDCVYPEGVTVDRVFSNHYGASSTLRTAVKKAETTSFTSAEQAQMLSTTIYTADPCNNTVYAVSDKLYVPQGNAGERFVTVGANTADALDSGLRIDSGYWPSSGYWLRTADSDARKSHNAILATSGLLSSISAKGSRAVVPAFQLDLSSVLFASTASAATSDGAVASGEVLTLRFASGDLGAAEVAADKTQVRLSDVPEGVYLVAQNGKGTWAKHIDQQTEVTAADMGEGFTDFQNCEVWLEQASAKDNLIYAAKATEEVLYRVTVETAKGITLTSGSADQTVKAGTAISPITLQADALYVMPDGYETSIEGLNGLTVTRHADTITISGIPSANATLTLKALAYKDADYTKVNAAIAKAEALNKEDYKDFSAVEKAINAVVFGKNITEQETVDGYAAAIEEALKGLEKKPAAPAPTEDTTPQETDPQETKPQETDPQETKPQETKPQESKPQETKPQESKPQETKPQETKPQEVKPAEKPVSPQTGDRENLMLLSTLFVISLMGLALVSTTLTRRKSTK